MKLKHKILSALIVASLTTATFAGEKREIEVMIDSDGTNTTKTVTLNGVELNAEEIAELEASGELHVQHLDDGDHDGIRHEVKVLVNDDGEVTTESISINGKQLSIDEIADMKANGNLKVIHLDRENLSGHGKDIHITVDSDGISTTKKIIMDGKELSEEEIAELEASGELKTLHLDTSGIGGHSFKKIMVFNSDDNGDNKHFVNMFTKSIQIDDDNATLGFMTNIKDDGWHVISVIEGSGAEEAGLKAGDIIKFMGEKDLTSANGNTLPEKLNMTKREEGEMVDLEVERNGKLIYMSAEARKNNAFDMVMDIKVDGDTSNFEWFDKLKGHNTFVDGQNMKVMVMNGDVGKSINFDNVDFDLPKMLGNMNIFVSDGNSTSKLLGKNHEMSTLSDGLSSYFGTKDGVLLMHVGKDNVFGLEDGDIIKSIDGNDVNTPKDVIKQLLKSDKQENLKIKIVRHKRNKTLKYNK